MANWKLGKTQYGFLSTATAGGTLTLVAGSKQIQVFTGTLAHTMKLPDATTTSNGSGISFSVINQSTGAITVQDNGSNLIATVAAGSSADFLLTNVSTPNGVWRVSTFASSGGGGEGFAGMNSYFGNFSATGGTITQVNGRTIHTFTSSGTFQITAGSGAIDSLVVAGGGSGGSENGGGGGAGGLIYTIGQALSAGSYTVTIGAGGALTSTGGVIGNSGSNSVFGSITAIGGGGGGGHTGPTAGLSGGSGGGGTGGSAAGSATAGQGFAGGVGFNSGGASGAGGGGGGSGGVGAPGVTGTGQGNGGNGGLGTANSISGASVFYASGGGGGTGDAGVAGTASAGGGGNGATSTAGNTVPGSNATANTGGGGGGGGFNSAGGAGGAGGSGIVIISYLPNSYSILVGDKGKVLNADTTVAAFTFTLPAPVSGFVITIKDIAGTSATNNIRVLPNGSETIDGFPQDVISLPYGAVTYLSDGVNWFRMSCFSGSNANVPASYAPTPAAGRGLFGGGNGPSSQIDYVTIATAANALSFGQLTVARTAGPGSFASSTRGVWAGGNNGSVSVNTVDYVTISNLSNASTFGALNITRQQLAACGNATRGLITAGQAAPVTANVEYFTIATLGNGSNFGTLLNTGETRASCASQTRAVIGGGDTTGAGAYTTAIEYLTIATTGGGTSFGVLTQARGRHTSCANSTRGVWAGGNNGSDQSTIDYVTIATAANAISFGALSLARRQLASCSNSSRALFGGGLTGADQNLIDFIAFNTLATATSFGNLTSVRDFLAGCSNSHGGL